MKKVSIRFKRRTDAFFLPEIISLYSNSFHYSLFCVSNTISRVMYLMIIYLGLMLPPGSIDLPESTTGSRIAFCLVFLRMGFTYAGIVTNTAVVS